jgi:hypothetical protein
VRKSIASQSAESQKTHMKQFNSNGYRVVSLMVFGDQASACNKRCQPGSVIAVLNPKIMTAKPD